MGSFCLLDHGLIQTPLFSIFTFSLLCLLSLYFESHSLLRLFLLPFQSPSRARRIIASRGSSPSRAWRDRRRRRELEQILAFASTNRSSPFHHTSAPRRSETVVVQEAPSSPLGESQSKELRPNLLSPSKGNVVFSNKSLPPSGRSTSSAPSRGRVCVFFSDYSIRGNGCCRSKN
ncbi:hypothetical protein TIFTF001_007880 [Ficus carica]|uniref:Uncharacterized protein n=1 Tax=Ficus carica TaxID=3494 RepID=A0AA88D025_FICCA|nr:hypothetical protein TIFTF001_007880 [Ficus carica]